MLSLIKGYSSTIMVALLAIVVALGITVYVQTQKISAAKKQAQLDQVQLQVSNASINDLTNVVNTLNAQIKQKSANDLAEQQQTKQILQAVNAKNSKVDAVINNLNKNVGKKNADGSTPKDIADAWKSL